MKQNGKGFLQISEIIISIIAYSEGVSPHWIFSDRPRLPFPVYKEKCDICFGICAQFSPLFPCKWFNLLAIWKLEVAVFEFLCVIELQMYILQSLTKNASLTLLEIYLFICICSTTSAVSAREFSIGHQLFKTRQ